MRSVALHVFCSVKGGVGKSTLAVATGKLLAGRGRAPVVLDADMLGASLADGLRLCAPRVTLNPQGLLDLERDSADEWHTLAETRRLRLGRKAWLEQHDTEIHDFAAGPVVYRNSNQPESACSLLPGAEHPWRRNPRQRPRSARPCRGRSAIGSVQPVCILVLRQPADLADPFVRAATAVAAQAKKPIG